MPSSPGGNNLYHTLTLAKACAVDIEKERPPRISCTSSRVSGQGVDRMTGHKMCECQVIRYLVCRSRGSVILVVRRDIRF